MLLARYAVRALAQMYKIIMGRESLDHTVTPDFLRAQLARAGFTDDSLPTYRTAKEQYFDVRPHCPLARMHQSFAYPCEFPVCTRSASLW